MASKEINSATEGKPFDDKDAEALDSMSIVLGEIANDFNNIMSLIFGYVEMALSEIPDNHRARSDLEHVLAAGDRAKEHIARVLTFSNQNKLRQTEINIQKPVSNAINTFRDKLPGNIKLDALIEDKNTKVIGNQVEVFQVLTNLLHNSMQAIGQNNGHIKVMLETQDTGNTQKGDAPADGFVKLIVIDDGCGMDLDTLAKIYNPFFSHLPASLNAADSAEKRAGLGLTTVYNIISNMNGKISVESRLNEGTVVEVVLPLAASEVSSGSGQADNKAATSSKRVLFIDDEEAITSMATQMLKKNHYEITTFTDAEQAITHFKDNHHLYDVAITDLVMPETPGTEVALRLANIKPGLPIILTTGFSEKITSSSCHKWGISLVINKPFAIRDLLTAIESIT